MLLTDVQRHVDASGIAGEAREERDEEAAKKGDAEGGELDVPVRVGISRHAARGRNKNLETTSNNNLNKTTRKKNSCSLSFFFTGLAAERNSSTRTATAVHTSTPYSLSSRSRPTGCELTRGCALGPPARLQPVDKSCHQQSRTV